MAEPLRIGFVAGESSGDQLGAALITALRARAPELRCYGVAGAKMRAAGCDAWASSDELAVMGLVEPLRRLPRLMRLRSMLRSRFRAERPDVFVGIDAPAFNLGLEAQLKRAGLRTVQYVSPQVWAWRQSRVRAIARACDLVLCLLPFEPDFYARYGVRALFVGHPLADQIPLDVDRAAARRELAIDAEAALVALLPGSRIGEVERLGADFLAAVRWLSERRPDLQFIAPMASAAVRAVFERQMAAADVPGVRLIDGQAQCVLAACNAVLVASGTATLEALLSKRPMVVAYRFAALTAFVLRRLEMVKVRYFAQPNLLAGRRLVPEFLQEEVTGEALGAALLGELDNPARAAELEVEFRRVHEQLRRGGAERAAAAILELVQGRAT
ncbi:MAG TPA: lipid-A-disaccharide synthase [Steroidobacteraceae bacterium]|jgi:lipid-A-disaccharide synthase|nr:lipid-A-disaccharide synthase [Steroidobacteraceae bacterium]